jgi:hypothetical protein
MTAAQARPADLTAALRKSAGLTAPPKPAKAKQAKNRRPVK